MTNCQPISTGRSTTSRFDGASGMMRIGMVGPIARLKSWMIQDSRPLAIAATIYPRDTDLLEEPTLRRNPVTIDEIEQTLRQIVERLEEQGRANPDPLILGAEGLYEAWRVYKNRPPTKETQDHRAAAGTTRRIIERALEYLCKQRCFKTDGTNYQPLWRYQVLLQEYAASHAYRAIKRVLEPQIES
jgi:hypothetical protein